MPKEEIINNLTWKVGGEAGMGILNAGMMFAKICMRGGLWTQAHAIYPSLIRGGHNHLDVRISDKQITSHGYHIDVLVALNRETFDIHKDKLTAGSAVIFDGDAYKIEASELPRKDIKLIHVPLLELAKQHGGKIMRNTVAMGATVGLVDFDIKLFDDILEQTFKRKGEEIVQNNISAADAGYNFVRDNYGNDFKYKLRKQKENDTMLISGNESLALGAVRAGCKLICAYPMTPASSIMVDMAKWNCGVVVKQTEDELAAMNMTVGANYAGVRAMTATSGGGFALMTEGYGMAAMSETPIVVVDAQRPGPATGVATQSGQGDLHFILNAAPDDFARILLAPGDCKENYELGFQAFNLAEKYQLPVAILTDKYLGESFWTVPTYDTKAGKIDRGKLLSDKDAEKQKEYKRYKLTDDSISPRAIPGQKNCMHVATSYEHNEHGTENEEEQVRIDHANKRFARMHAALDDIPDPQVHGDANADLTVIAWGSTKGVILEAMQNLKQEGIKVNFMQMKYMFPLKEKAIKNIFKKAKSTVLVENNQTGQLGLLLRKYLGLEIDHKILKYDGRPFYLHELTDELRKVAKKNGKKRS